MPNERNELQNFAKNLTVEQVATLNKIARALFSEPEDTPGEPALTCHFCRTSKSRSVAENDGWVPGFRAVYADLRSETTVYLPLPVCRPCACERLSYNARVNTYDLKK